MGRFHGKQELVSAATAPIAMADQSSNLQVTPADQSNQSVWLAVSSLLDGRQALLTWVKSDNEACVWGARHSLHAASLHASVRGLCSHYLHHNNEQMCKAALWTQYHRLKFPQSEDYFRQLPTNHAILPVFFHSARKHGGFASFPFRYLNWRHHTVVRSIGAKAPFKTEELQLRPRSCGCSSLCSVTQTDETDMHYVGWLIANGEKGTLLWRVRAGIKGELRFKSTGKEEDVRCWWGIENDDWTLKVLLRARTHTHKHIFCI